MNNGWTTERKVQQAAAIHRWKPWLCSTGPKSNENKAIVARNAYKGAERPKMRQLMKLLRRELKGQQGYLDSIHG